MTPGILIKVARVHAGLTQAQLADTLGLDSPQSISNIERNLAPVPAKYFAMICKTLKLDRRALARAIAAEVIKRYLNYDQNPA